MKASPGSGITTTHLAPWSRGWKMLYREQEHGLASQSSYSRTPETVQQGRRTSECIYVNSERSCAPRSVHYYAGSRNTQSTCCLTSGTEQSNQRRCIFHGTFIFKIRYAVALCHLRSWMLWLIACSTWAPEHCSTYHTLNTLTCRRVLRNDQQSSRVCTAPRNT